MPLIISYIDLAFEMIKQQQHIWHIFMTISYFLVFSITIRCNWYAKKKKKKKTVDSEMKSKLLRFLYNADSLEITNSNNIHEYTHPLFFCATTITTKIIACDTLAVNK